MRTIGVAIALSCSLFVAAAFAASFTQNLAPGDTVHNNCPTQLVGTLSDVACATPVPPTATPTHVPTPTATPAPAMVWMVPQVTPLGQGTGYIQYCDTNEVVTLCGTYPAQYAFTCNNPINFWLSRDEDNTGWGVHFSKPTVIAGFKWMVWAAISNPDPTRTYTQTWAFRDSTDTKWGLNADGSDYMTPGTPFFTAVATNIPDRVWTQYQWTLPTPVTVNNLRMDFEGDTWATTQPVSILTQSTTPRSC